MTKYEAMALVQELASLCIIFPVEKLDEPVEFPPSSTLFRLRAFSLVIM
jgi:hypothetical protein